MIEAKVLDEVGRRVRRSIDDRVISGDVLRRLGSIGVTDDEAGLLADFLLTVRFVHSGRDAADAGCAFVSNDREGARSLLVGEGVSEQGAAIALALADRMVDYRFGP